jgi:hypothetical protein
MSFHNERVILTAVAGRLLERDEQRDRRERHDHHQLEIVDVGNDLCLQRDHGVQRGAPGIGRGIRKYLFGRTELDGSVLIRTLGLT